MKNNFNWQDLLVVAGFEVNEENSNEFHLINEKRQNIAYLGKLLTAKSIRHFFRHPFDMGYPKVAINTTVLKIGSSPLPFDEWVKTMQELGTHGMENGSYQDLEIISVEIPMRGVVRQINRLGMGTMGSCAGHPEKKPSAESHIWKCIT